MSHLGKKHDPEGQGLLFKHSGPENSNFDFFVGVDVACWSEAEIPPWFWRGIGGPSPTGGHKARPYKFNGHIHMPKIDL